MMIGKNILLGNGFVVTPLDPPALWRPILAPLLCALVELFAQDPKAIFQTIYTASLTIFTVSSFYASRAIWGLTTAHLSCLFIITSPALTWYLVAGLHTLSHVTLLLTIGPTLCCTLLALKKQTRLRLALAGLGWGVTYLARWETLLFFAASLATVACKTYLDTKRLRQVACSLWTLPAFLALFLPYQLYKVHVQNRYGIWGPSLVTTFYASETWVHGLGNEAAGYAEAIRKYGSLESNNYSLISAISRNPRAFASRLATNVRKFASLYFDREFFDPLWLPFLLFVVLDLHWFRITVPIYIYLFLLFLSSTSVCVLHIDPRYAIISLPSLMFCVCAGLARFWRLMTLNRQRSTVALGVVVVSLFTCIVSGRSLAKLVRARRSHGRLSASRGIQLAKGLAKNFVAATGAGPPKVVAVELPSTSKVAPEDLLMISYFGGTGLVWPPSEVFPRDKIFSMVFRPTQYAYFPDEYLVRTDILLSARLLSVFRDAELGTYCLFSMPVTLKSLDELGGDEHERMLAVLRRDFPTLVDRYRCNYTLAKARAALTLCGQERTADRVGCGLLAWRADGRYDKVFRLEFSAPKDASWLASQGPISYIELGRRNPRGFSHTSSSHFLLGVAQGRSGALINRPDGSVSIQIKDKDELWLYVCDDGANRPDSTYQARLKVGTSGWITSETVRLDGEQFAACVR